MQTFGDPAAEFVLVLVLVLVLDLVASDYDYEDDDEDDDGDGGWRQASPSRATPVPLQMHTGGSISPSGVHREGYWRGTGGGPAGVLGWRKGLRGGSFRLSTDVAILQSFR